MTESRLQAISAHNREKLFLWQLLGILRLLLVGKPSDWLVEGDRIEPALRGS